MKWISIDQLDKWASTLQARTEIPELVADLIRASADTISDIRFPSRGKGQIRGFDGWLEAVGTPPFVPDGKSVWEFGVSGASGSKLTKDYKKRTAEVPASNRANLTLVLVTPFTWDDPKVKVVDWVQAKQAEKAWKDVRLLEGPHLITWLEDCPSVAARWARSIGAQPAEVRSTDEYWDEYVVRFKTPISEDVILCGRAKKAAKLIEGLLQPNGSVAFVADSPEEVVAFAVAAIRKADATTREYLEARTLVVDSEAAGRALRTANQGVFLPRGQGMASIALLAANGPTLKAGSYDRPDQGAEVLDRPSTHDLAKAFEDMGIERDEAAKIARDCGRSITVLARTYAGAGHADIPSWQATGDKLIVPLLAVGWDALHTMDRDVLALLGGRPYEDIERELRPFLRTEDPPLEQNGSVWRLRAPVDAFVNVAHRLGSSDLERFRLAAIQVLSEVEPDPKPDDYIRTLEVQTTRYSDWLRDGIATTVLQISALSKAAGLTLNGVSPQVWVNELIGALNLDKDHRLLASLRNQLTYLMEAAPGPLLEALEHLLEGDKIAPIFAEVDGPIFPQSRHTGLLWALETLAWDPTHLIRVCDILARLALIDPGGRMTNRPINSLREILLPWSPNTFASDELRFAALETIERRSTDIAWLVCVSLLPRDHDISSPTTKPRFKEAGQDNAVDPTHESLAVFYTALARRVLSLARGHAVRTAELVPILERLGGEPWDEAVFQISAFMSNATPEARRPVWDALVHLRDRHRRFASAEWGLPPNHLEQIQILVEEFAPSDATARLGDLFDDWFPSILGAIDPDDTAILAARRQAAREILDQSDAEEHLIDLASRSKLPWSVGQAAAYEIDELDILAKLIALALREPTDSRVEFAGSVSSIARLRFPDAWPARLKALILEEAVPTEQGIRLIFPWPETDVTWDFVESLGLEFDRAFWKSKRAFRVQPGDADLIRTVRKYVEVGRPDAALDAASARLEELTAPIVLQLLDAYINVIVDTRSEDFDGVMGRYKLEQIFKFLDINGKLSLEEIVRREIRVFPLLHRGQRPLSLHALMAKSGTFYGEILALVYPPEALGELSDEEKETRKRRAQVGFKVLHDFKQSPGKSGEPTQPNKQAILTWVAEVRAANTNPERNALYDIYVGQALANMPIDPDGGWPHRALRDAVEELAAADIERGIATRRYNMRGVFMKSIYEGGGQERAIATEYRKWRDLSTAWPRTSALLESIAVRWDRTAEESDTRASQDMMKDS
ncbi:hypothetical protein BBF93_00300 [Hyphomonas sp. CACIAM 19H1]|uniref:hypothetical protein n=1 Tax=Hyphomonas sp. CACIAM 19H1 TaxID=1873716 RepID=UPI000DEDD3DB|nr:hypothetical protein [Hyphomonas sp. CACIAM 19H1]AXE62817.1 hypothetical protein BBF93_00300 [Hyphomonas sp. CACIAM 19H1]